MYRRDQKSIQRYVSGPDELEHVCLLVVLSIRCDWRRVGKDLEDVRKRGDESPALWGHKIQAYEDIKARKAELFDVVTDLRAGRIDETEALESFVSIHGLGLAKAGFVLQLVAGKVGCFDSHNFKRFGLNPNHFRLTPKLSAKTREAKIRAYVDLCRSHGSENLWNGWCEYLAQLKPAAYRDADQVSRLHLDHLGLAA